MEAELCDRTYGQKEVTNIKTDRQTWWNPNIWTHRHDEDWGMRIERHEEDSHTRTDRHDVFPNVRKVRNDEGHSQFSQMFCKRSENECLATKFTPKAASRSSRQEIFRLLYKLQAYEPRWRHPVAVFHHERYRVETQNQNSACILRERQCHNRAVKVPASHFVGPKFESRPSDWASEEILCIASKCFSHYRFPLHSSQFPIHNQPTTIQNCVTGGTDWSEFLTSEDSAENKHWLYRTYIPLTCWNFNGPHSGYASCYWRPGLHFLGSSTLITGAP